MITNLTIVTKMTIINVNIWKGYIWMKKIIRIGILCMVLVTPLLISGCKSDEEKIHNSISYIQEKKYQKAIEEVDGLSSNQIDAVRLYIDICKNRDEITNGIGSVIYNEKNEYYAKILTLINKIEDFKESKDFEFLDTELKTKVWDIKNDVEKVYYASNPDNEELTTLFKWLLEYVEFKSGEEKDFMFMEAMSIDFTNEKVLFGTKIPQEKYLVFEWSECMKIYYKQIDDILTAYDTISAEYDNMEKNNLIIQYKEKVKCKEISDSYELYINKELGSLNKNFDNQIQVLEFTYKYGKMCAYLENL